jgi:small subunit ribosomal protein S4e
MDVIQVPEIKKNYRVLYDEKGRLILHEISQDEASFKLCMVIRKSVVKGGRMQLAFHDGKTSIGEFGEFNLQDVVKLSLPDFKVEERLAFEKEALVLITGGRSVGKTGKIQDIQHVKEAQSDLVTVKSDAATFQSPKNYVFPIGKEKPVISLPGG